MIDLREDTLFRTINHQTTKDYSHLFNHHPKEKRLGMSFFRVEILSVLAVEKLGRTTLPISLGSDIRIL